MGVATRIVRLRKQNPLLSNQNIAEKVGCTRQYVHKVIRKASLPNPPRKRNVRFCKICGSESTAKVHKGRCSYEYYRPEVVCSFCRVKFRRHLTALRQGYNRGYEHIYCSEGCYHRGRMDVTKTWAR